MHTQKERMWMMGYNEEVNLQTDSFNGRKFRPLVPRSTSTSFSSPIVTGPKLDNFSFNPHLGIIDQTKRELNTQQVVVTSRWNPTPEQLQTLEELYQRGTRTPSADQIQQITSQLRRYGKIEGKNVFYWFQNHKARERQKRRRQNESEPDPEQQQMCRDYDNAQCKESGVEANIITGVEIEQTKSCCWRYTSSSNITLVPDLHQHQKTATLALKAAADDLEFGRGNADGWLSFDKKELPQKPFLQRNSTWQILNRPFTNATTTTTTTISTTVTNSDTVDTINPSFVKSTQDQTLQLFPLRSDNKGGDGEREAENDTCHLNYSYQFFEFLPLKEV